MVYYYCDSRFQVCLDRGGARLKPASSSLMPGAKRQKKVPHQINIGMSRSVTKLVEPSLDGLCRILVKARQIRSSTVGMQSLHLMCCHCLLNRYGKLEKLSSFKLSGPMMSCIPS